MKQALLDKRRIDYLSIIFNCAEQKAGSWTILSDHIYNIYQLLSTNTVGRIENAYSRILLKAIVDSACLQMSRKLNSLAIMQQSYQTFD